MNPWQLWVEALDDPHGRWVIWIFVLLTLIAMAVYVGKWFRDMAVGGSNQGLQQWSEFEQLHAKGKLSHWEYQRLKATVPQRLAEQLRTDRDSQNQDSVSLEETEPQQAEMNIQEKQQDPPG